MKVYGLKQGEKNGKHETNLKANQPEILKALIAFGDKSLSNALINNTEAKELLEELYKYFNQLPTDEALTLEEKFSAYTAMITNQAYLVGFRDCMDLRDSLSEIGNTSTVQSEKMPQSET